MLRYRVKRRRKIAIGATMLAAIAALCINPSPAFASSRHASTASGARRGGTATFAEFPGLSPNYIFPFMSAQYSNNTNSTQFQWLMYLPLYWYGTSGTIGLNKSLSVAEPPVVSDNGRVVTISIKPGIMWSNGTHVDAADVIFWMNMLEANKTDWAAYAPGSFPDDVAKYAATGPNTVVFTMREKYSPNWLSYSAFEQITPLPLAWDLVGANTPGTCATSVTTCKAVYNYLNSLSSNTSTFVGNPLWQIVDGPWRLITFTSEGKATFVPNVKYTAGRKPYLSEFIETPFTSASSEYSVLQSSDSLDVGYIPLEDAPERGGENPVSGYKLAPWTQWAIYFGSLNMSNPKTGSVFRQQYIRQAMQYLIDQPALVRSVTKGWGYPTYGPVPSKPKSNLVTPNIIKKNPYPYSVAKAKALLTSHGWQVHAGGVTICNRPGVDSNECGRDIAKGTKLSFSLVYPSGEAYLQSMFAFIESTFEHAVGIRLNLSTQPLSELFGDTVPCSSNSVSSSCNWDIHDWGGWAYTPPISFPSGGIYMECGAAENVTGFCSKTLEAAITKVHHTGGSAELAAEQKVAAKLLPEMYLPEMPYQLTEVKNGLRGVLPQEPSLAIAPQFWYFQKQQ